MRNWPATLFAASFAGVPFWVKEDSASTGRRVNTALFPGVDAAFNEDMGRTAQRVEITGYLIGDFSDSEISALEAVCESISTAATLVLPAQGPVQARCTEIKRSRRRDAMGMFSFTAHFVREGLGSPLSPAPYLAQLAFDAVGALSAAAAGFLSGVSL